MIPKELVRKIRKIEIRTNRLVNDVLSGQYHSVFQGQGIEFAEVREYQPGDDIRSIDWNVTARTGHPFIKRFHEERELTVMLLVDASASHDFGTANPIHPDETPKTKQEIAAELCALLAFSAIKNNDKVGLIMFTNEVEKYIPPKKGRQHVLRVIREVLYFQPKSRQGNISVALEFFNRVTTRRSVAFLLSDFIDQGYDNALKTANRKHDCIAITVNDPREIELPNVGLIELEDAETGATALIDTRSATFREQYRQQQLRRIETRNAVLKQCRVDAIHIDTAQPYVDPLVKFFRMRAARFR
ncbi:MAG: DUF58 domain-containing protein [Gemmatimonadetes bacterium]|nr:MAG: DUF58 domain-containing protein [Gemmatimonadota bacterium]